MSGSLRGVPAAHAPRLERMLDRLHASSTPADMHLPGWKRHPLRGAREGTWAVWVSASVRLTFRFHGEHAVDVDLEDYH